MTSRGVALLTMEYLVLGLALLAGTLTAGSPLHRRDLIKEVALDMAPNSFDDQYRGCGRMMKEELQELNRTEFTNNSVYANAWTIAAAEWRNRRGRVPQTPTLRPEHAIAFLAYTQQGPLYRAFNVAVREAGRSRGEYLRNFHFKVLHFLLTEALHSLRDTRHHQCHRVYRGVQGIRFTARSWQSIRFGHFTSASLRYESTQNFGQDTFFSMETCYGVPIRDFSSFPEEEEVLIPPFESFEVTSVTRNGSRALIQLRSQAANSTYNCEFVKGDVPAGRSLAATGVQRMGRRGGSLMLPALPGKSDGGEGNGGDLGLGCACLQWGALAAKHGTARHGTVW